jgi:hypothetical protein
VAESVDQERDRVVERRRGEHDVPEPDAVGEEPARHQRRGGGRDAVGEAEHDVDDRTERRRRPHEAVDAPRLEVVGAALGQLMAGGAQPRDDGVEARLVDRLEPDGDAVVGPR